MFRFTFMSTSQSYVVSNRTGDADEKPASAVDFVLVGAQDSSSMQRLLVFELLDDVF